MRSESLQSGSDRTNDEGLFRVRCDAETDGGFSLHARSLCVTVGQRVLRQGLAQIWDSVSIHADEDADGNLIIEVFVFRPEWDEPLRIARICSRPGDTKCPTLLGCNLDHVAP